MFPCLRVSSRNVYNSFFMDLSSHLEDIKVNKANNKRTCVCPSTWAARSWTCSWSHLVRVVSTHHCHSLPIAPIPPFSAKQYKTTWSESSVAAFTFASEWPRKTLRKSSAASQNRRASGQLFLHRECECNYKSGCTFFMISISELTG